jgi:PKD repeat protein
MTASLRFGVCRRMIGGLAVVTVLSACTGRYESEFPVIVVNRTANTIQALANGQAVGSVDAGQTQSFSLKLPESNPNVFVNGTQPTPRADVTFSARDLRTGALSSEKSVTLFQDTPTSVAFTPDDFPSSVPTVARFTFSPTNPTINQDVSFNASASSVSNGTYVWDFGDGQSGSDVTTTHRYQRGGTFTIVLTVTSDSKQSSTASRTINVSTVLPPQVANFTFSPTAPAINQDVVFTVPLLPGPGGGAQGATFSWDFGDGTTGTGTPITHRYTRGGTFAVTLRVTSGLLQRLVVHAGRRNLFMGFRRRLQRFRNHHHSPFHVGKDLYSHADGPERTRAIGDDLEDGDCHRRLNGARVLRCSGARVLRCSGSVHFARRFARIPEP